MSTVGDQHRPLRDVVCQAIRNQIMNGDHAPGTRLVEERLAQQLGVSRNPVREALRVLEAEGFVEMIPRRGAVVASLSDEEVDEIFEVRSALEALAARLAARKATDDQRRRLDGVLADTAVALQQGEPAQLSVLNTRFHELVMEMAANGFLRDVMAPLRGRMQWIFSRTVGRRAADSLREHSAMAEAIAAGDEELAAHLAAGHIAAARRSYVDSMASMAKAPG